LSYLGNLIISDGRKKQNLELIIPLGENPMTRIKSSISKGIEIRLIKNLLGFVILNQQLTAVIIIIIVIIIITGHMKVINSGVTDIYY